MLANFSGVPERFAEETIKWKNKDYKPRKRADGLPKSLPDRRNAAAALGKGPQGKHVIANQVGEFKS